MYIYKTKAVEVSLTFYAKLRIQLSPLEIHNNRLIIMYFYLMLHAQTLVYFKFKFNTVLKQFLCKLTAYRGIYGKANEKMSVFRASV